MSRATEAAWRKRQKERGLCIHCTAKAVDGQTQCEEHRRLSRAAVAARRAHRAAQGLCRDCSGRRICRSIYCADCLDKQQARSAAARGYDVAAPSEECECGNVKRPRAVCCDECARLDGHLSTAVARSSSTPQLAGGGGVGA